MAEKKTTPIVIDDKEYTFEDMTAEQQEMVNHVADLDRKLQSTRYKITQLEGGRKFFIDMLKESLADTPVNALTAAAE
jgi:hypothetical protein